MVNDRAALLSELCALYDVTPEQAARAIRQTEEVCAGLEGMPGPGERLEQMIAMHARGLCALRYGMICIDCGEHRPRVDYYPKEKGSEIRHSRCIDCDNASRPVRARRSLEVAARAGRAR